MNTNPNPTLDDFNVLSENLRHNEKQIQIQGTQNRYQIKKLTQTKVTQKRQIRTTIEAASLPDEYWTSHSKQYNLLKESMELSLQTPKKRTEKKAPTDFLKTEMERKLASYRQQDKEKNILDLLSFISLEKVQRLLVQSEMTCFYCSCQVFLFYEWTRENKQWTLDRIDNDKGHNDGNVVISCLECNLQRRRTHQDKFLFTKQLKIVKQDHP